MYHGLRSLAESRFFDVEKFTEFAHQHEDKYGLVGAGKGENATVSTWHVDDLCEAFKKAGGERIVPNFPVRK